MLRFTSFTASASIDELAASAGVSPATITRFARSLACASCLRRSRISSQPT
ncbi:MarR family transcriptional regulator, partial [Klebsiella pneumoniae]|uniref:MarR family transcriptional regulator n=1 Tax=Klebsiella pneumoniae TaxID=573 RepID=UPI003FD32583